jgi:hypothetical protein
MGPFQFLQRTFGVPDDCAKPAVNVNTMGGVPNSSWYTNRHYRHPMTERALRRGPNVESGPTSTAWRVVRVNGDKPLPRAVVRDSTGRRFQLLFDAPAHPEMATGAGMIGSRLMYALGYNVPQHWLRYIAADQLVPGPDSITHAGVDQLLTRAARRSDGTYRVLATRIPDVGQRIGPFRFRDTRPDDPNDIFPHQHRRELRGLTVFAAWMHHSKLQSRHTLDVGVEEDGRQFVRHYFTDLYLTLGSAGTTPKSAWSGHEYVLEFDEVLERVVTLGLSGADWAEAEPPDWPALGHFTSEAFDPRDWRPEWPNAAFQRADSSDTFWAAKQVRGFSRADIEAIVESADYSSSAVEKYVTRTLVRRRNAIGRAYLRWGGGLDQFAVSEGRLTFQDLPATYGLVADSLQRTVTWHVFNNPEDRAGQKLDRTQSTKEAIPLPLTEASYLRATIRTTDRRTTCVYLRRTDSRPFSTASTARYEVVGVQRSGKTSEACVGPGGGRVGARPSTGTGHRSF